MSTTVLISANDPKAQSGNHVVNFYIDTITELYDKMTSDPNNVVNDLAIILQVNGVDVASKCSHCEDDCELF
jgi:hypothetical protein